MAVKIRLKRFGKKRAPYYRVVVMDSRTKRDGRAIEEIGKYHPTEEPSVIEINSERAQYWLSVGAQPTEQVTALLKLTGDWGTFKGEKGATNTVKVKGAKASPEEQIKATADAAEKLKAAKASEKAAAAEAKAAEAKAAEEAASAEAPVEDAAPAEPEAAADAPVEDAAPDAEPEAAADAPAEDATADAPADTVADESSEVPSDEGTEVDVEIAEGSPSDDAEAEEK
jgi:small subunit ribosomal protein S16